MSDEEFLRNVRLVLRYQSQNGPGYRQFDDNVLHITEHQDGISVVGAVVPRGLILYWKQTGLFYDVDRPRRPEEEAHLEKLVVLYAMAQEGF